MAFITATVEDITEYLSAEGRARGERWEFGGVHNRPILPDGSMAVNWDAYVQCGPFSKDTDPRGYSTRRGAAVGARRLAARLNTKFGLARATA
jgi:hypothetical protein